MNTGGCFPLTALKEKKRKKCAQYLRRGSEHSINELLIVRVKGALQLVKVEREVARLGAVESCLVERRPLALQ